MAIFTSEELSEQIAAWKAALLAISTGQEYTIGERRLTRADLREVRETLRFLDSEQTAAAATSGARRVLAVPRSDTW